MKRRILIALWVIASTAIVLYLLSADPNGNLHGTRENAKLMRLLF